MTEPENQSWEETLVSLREQSLFLDAIHEALPGKENLQAREELCKPHRSVCVRLHWRRIELSIQMQQKGRRHGTV